MLCGGMLTLVAGVVFLALVDVKKDFDTWGLKPVSSFHNGCEGASDEALSQRFVEWSRTEQRALAGARSATLLSLHAFVREEFGCS